MAGSAWMNGPLRPAASGRAAEQTVDDGGRGATSGCELRDAVPVQLDHRGALDEVHEFPSEGCDLHQRPALAFRSTVFSPGVDRKAAQLLGRRHA